MFILSLFQLFFVEQGRLTDASGLIKIMRYGVFFWSGVLFYLGLINYTKRKVILIGVLLISMALAGYASTLFQQTLFNFLGSLQL